MPTSSQTAEAVHEAHGVYRRALDRGVDKYLEGRAVEAYSEETEGSIGKGSMILRATPDIDNSGNAFVRICLSTWCLESCRRNL